MQTDNMTPPEVGQTESVTPTRPERVRQASRILRQNLAQLAADLGDLSQSEFVGLEPFETELIDISSQDVQSGNGREIGIQGGIGLAIQFLPPNPLPNPDIGDVRVYINRPDGFSVDPRVDKIIPVWPIIKLYVKAKQGATGGVRIRVFKDPTFLFTVSPESALLGEVKVQNSSGVLINPATEDTLSALNAQFQNRSSGYSKQYSVGTSVVTGDNQAVPDGKAIAIWSDSDNSAEVAFTFDGTTNPAVGTHAGLKPGQGISIALTNINKIKMVAASGTQKINISVET